MPSGYSHLSESERYHLYISLKQGKSVRSIARDMGRHHATLNREIARNTGERGYRYKQAQRFAETRHKTKPKARKWNTELKAYVTDKIKQRWSPEQISGRLTQEGKVSVVTETIYRFLLADQKAGGTLYLNLRHKSKRYRKRYGSNDYRGKIPGRVSIDERPALVDKKTRLGDWEADLVVGAKGQGAIVTLAERLSRLYLALPIVQKTAELTTQGIINLLKALSPWVKTITYDNGREFSWHQDISKTLECQGFFAHPYHSWERGLNENHNGLLRQYFPKGIPLNDITPEAVFAATDEMNNRPRKCLQFRTPMEVFTELTGRANIDFYRGGALIG